jgi:hypothetical protein
MTDDVRDDIAFIRRAIEEGRGYATEHGGDFVVWGIAMACAYVGTYATIQGWWRIDPAWLWRLLIAGSWVFSLRHLLRRVVARSPGACGARPMVHALKMVWVGCGIFLTTLDAAASVTGEIREGWFNAVSAGALGIGFFASAYLANLPWLRWVAVAWWGGELVSFWLRHQAGVLMLMAALMVLLLALPGLVVLRARPVPLRA